MADQFNGASAPTSLIKYDAARHALAECKAVDEVKDWANYALSIGIHEIEVRMRSERRIGQILIEQKAKIDSFIALARLQFNPGAKETCFVCNKYKSLAHAHHVVPLSIQAKRGLTKPDQRHVWLCPTHHSAVHILIGQAESKNIKASKSCINLLCDLTQDELGKLLEVFNGAYK